ncbi:ATP-binding protein [Geobacter anodireducens]|uniref:Nuclease SbcCD subunit C n=1 Tax=Geobacter soli TaxID=1510391 RepID=A0A0C1U492_9BACT|nr:AAA family ATPase [Geobacter soli]KIE42585.1 nuclease SbcCD subunit C [Geobacter soli]
MLWISRVELPAFGRFRGASFTFRPGMNLVYGRNEAGKSTLVAAISGTIFGFRKERDRFVPWAGGERCEARVSFAYNGREMTIARDFLSDRVQAVERGGERTLWRFEGKVSPLGRSSEREEYLSKIEDVWGFAEGDIFRNSVYVGQRDLRIEGDAGLTTRIKQLLSGFAELDYDAVVESLEKELFELTRRPGGRSRDRELEEVRARMAVLAEQWREASRAVSELAALDGTIAELRTAVAAGREDLDKGKRYLERVSRYHEAAAREEALRKDYDRIRAEREKVEALIAKRQSVEERLASLGEAAGLPDGFARTLEAWTDGSERLAVLERELAGLSADRTHAGPVLQAPALVLALLLWGAAAGAWFLLPLAWLPLAGCALAVTVFLVVRAVRAGQARSAETARIQGRIDGLSADAVRLREELDRTEAELETRLGTFDPLRVDDILREIDRAAEVRGELSRIESALGVLPPLEGIRSQEAELARELAVTRESMETLIGRGFPVMSPREYAGAEEKMRRLESEVAEKERLCLVKEQELAVVRRGSLDPEAIAEEGEELKAREIRLVRRVEALRLAVDLLRETLDEYRATYLSRLGSEINGKLYNLTAGRYREAILDDGFTLSIGVEGTPRPVGALSCGAQDQAYLATRLALGGILSRSRKLPFLLDDPLVHFDEERRAAALTALNLAASDHQVILLVHDERYLKARGADLWHRIKIDTKGQQDGQLHLL